MLLEAKGTGETGGHTPRKTNSREDNALKHFARPMLLSPLLQPASTRRASFCYVPLLLPVVPGMGYPFTRIANTGIDRLPITSRKTRQRHAKDRESEYRVPKTRAASNINEYAADKGIFRADIDEDDSVIARVEFTLWDDS